MALLTRSPFPNHGRPARGRWLLGALALGALAAAGCSTTRVPPPPTGLDRSAGVALVPFANHTETPQAGLRAEAILESLMRAQGVERLRRSPAALNADTLFEPAERRATDAGLAWAREQRLRYAITGSVEEWRYKVGVDGEPAVGITLQLLDLQNGGAVVWSATGGRTGWSREALSAVAQQLLVRLSQPLAAGLAPAPSAR